MNKNHCPDKLTILIDTALGSNNTSPKDGRVNRKKWCQLLTLTNDHDKKDLDGLHKFATMRVLPFSN